MKRSGLVTVITVVIFLITGISIYKYISVPHDRPADVSLINASKQDDTVGIEKALAQGAKVDAKLQTSLLAQWMGWPLEGNEDYTPLHHAAIRGNKKAVALLIDRGADINAKTNIGSTPIMLAASEAQKDVIDLLIAHKADLSLKTTTGKSVTDFAVKRNMTKKYQQIVDLLVQQGAPPSQGGK